MSSWLRLSAIAIAFVILPSGAGIAQSAPPTETAAPAATAGAPAEQPAAPRKKKAKRMTRQQEIDRSVDTGTVPARYRSRVPKEYHQYIPFAR